MSKLSFRFAIVLLFAVFTFIEVRAEVFVVTSNADAGTGTLREALTKAAANGITEKDYIHFNLTDQTEAGRTITLLSQLPDVSSNLDIDGSTQAGNVFGVSTAKVQIITAFPFAGTYYGLSLIGVNDVGIYGLYIRNLLRLPSGVNTFQWQGILLRNIKNVNIGAIGKGNVISGFTRDIGVNFHFIGGQIQHYSQNLTIKSSFIGIEADGITLSPVAAYTLVIDYTYGNLAIGGSELEGNLIAKGLQINQANSSNTSDPLYSSPANITIKNNKIGTNINGNTTTPLATGVSIGASTPEGKNNVLIEDNVIAGEGVGIRISNSGYPVNIKRNYIGVDKTLTKRLTVDVGIFVYNANDVNIGSDDPLDANYIAYCKPVSVWPYSTVAVNKNSFFCTRQAYPMIFDTFGTRPFPKVEITSVTDNAVLGTANPNSQIELFYSDLCGTCSPETYFASTVADANGNWQYNGPIAKTVIASATLNGITSEFTRTRIDVAGITVKHTCSNTGSIIGALPLSATSVTWLDEAGNIVGTARDLLNVPIGKYRLKALSGDCSDITPFFEIKKAIILHPASIRITQPSCGVRNGEIKSILVTNNTLSPLLFSWKNELGDEVSRISDLLNAGPGVYTLTVSAADGSCTETYGPVTLTNTVGPNISLSSVLITPANCGSNSGSITGVTVTGSGTLSYKWKNANNVQVSTTKDLLNQPPGRYVLEVSDQSTCGLVSTSPISILESNGVTISDLQKQVFNPTCVGNNGSVKGLQITGATSFEWRDHRGQLVSAQIDLENLGPGDYQLTASNSSCSKTYNITLATQPNLINIGAATKILTDASCDINNGKIEVIFQNPVRLPRSYRWQNQSGQTVGGNSLTLENIDAGTYDLYGKDDNGCETFIVSYGISRRPVLAFGVSNHRIVHDNCNQKLGSISGLQINGGVAPYTYKWTNEAGTQVGNSLDVQRLSQGNYTLQVTDALNCSPLIALYSINNQSQLVTAPMVNPIDLCAPGTATLKINAVGNASSFALYANENNLTPMEVNTSGVFKVDVGGNKSYYVTQLIGDCESNKVEVKITVGLSGLTIPNTITPNNDGINDVWNLSGIENYPKALVQVFNRAGNKVYESYGYASPFDGTRNGTQLPIGVYYYMIKLDTKCELITGTLTLIR